MNKEKIVKTLNKYMNKIDKRLNVYSDDDLNLEIKTSNNIFQIAHFIDFDISEGFIIDGFGENTSLINESIIQELSYAIIQKNILYKFYTKAIELMNEHELKYTVQILKNSPMTYLKVDLLNGGIFFNSINQNEISNENDVKVCFTKSEIENMKKDSKFKGINFDEVIIKEVGKDEK